MSASANGPAQDLEALRRRIDAIDDQIHDLLMQRTSVVEEIAEIKQRANDVWYRPAREAALLRRLVGRHRGRLPKPAVVRLWRELLGATTRMQTDFRAAALRTPESAGCWELARDHFGGSVPLAALATPGQVVAAVAEGKATVGIVPLPQAEEPTPWWPLLLRDGSRIPRIAARLPFAPDGDGRGGEARGDEALVIACLEGEPTGRDRTVLAVESVEPVSRARLLSAMTEIGLPPALLVGEQIAGGSAGSRHVADIEDFVAAEDARVQRLRALLDGGGGVRVLRLGGYAKPLGKNELAA